jgi:DNA-binding response OmpR family regulator
VDGTLPRRSAARILVVDDELTPRMAITDALNLLGYQADEAASGVEALGMLASRPYDLMLLDLRMPGMDGVEVMKQARQDHADLLVIVLTAYGSLESAIEAVRIGAVDYLLKPSSIRDTEAAIALALRRRAERGEPHPPVFAGEPFAEGDWDWGDSIEPSDRFLHHGSITLDQRRNVVCISVIGDESSVNIQLTSSEAALLEVLMEHPSQVLSCRELAHSALGYDVSEREAQDLVRPHISRLRKKIEPDPVHPQSIRTVRGKGYLFSRA